MNAQWRLGRVLSRLERGTGRREPDVPFQPTPQRAVEQMLRLAGVHPGDLICDLGSGDGRIVITAAQRFGARAFGIDIDPRRVEESLRRAGEVGVLDRVSVCSGDFFEADVSRATVVTMFLWPEVTRRLCPMLRRELKPGTRVVSYFWEIADWVPDEEVAVDGRPIYLWTMPPRRPPPQPRAAAWRAPRP